MVLIFSKIQILLVCGIVLCAASTNLDLEIKLSSTDVPMLLKSKIYINNWGLSKVNAPTAESAPNSQGWRLYNTGQPVENMEIYFPKEAAKQPSLRVYQPATTFHPTINYKPTSSFSTTTLNKNSHHNFSTKLYQILAPKYATQNLIYSPFSIQSLLALLSLGAEGTTAQQLKDGLELPDSQIDLAKQFQMTLAETQSDVENFKFTFASKIYFKVNLNLASNFKQIAQEYFQSDIEPISFASKEIAANVINQWVSDKTEQHIKNIIDAQTLDASTQAILVNAIYMKVKWAKEFSTSDTLKMDFYVRNDMQHAKTVDMMYIEDDFRYGDFPELDACFIELPFLYSQLSMLIIVPNKIDGLFDMERRLRDRNLNEFVLKMQEKAITLRLPKFKIETKLEMMEPLEKLGIRDIFTENANLNKIFTNNSNVRISNVIHKAYIDVNEGGVEAAAASFGQIVPLSINPRMIYVTADHPFMFAVRSEKAVYFIGHVIDNFQ